jgi:hypothetical protein
VPKSANADNAMPMIAPYFMIASLRSAVRIYCLMCTIMAAPARRFNRRICGSRWL